MTGSVGTAMIGAIVKAMTPPDIQKEIADTMAKEIQEEIDWEIMMGMIEGLGYKHIVMKWPERMNEIQAHEIKEWCKSNLDDHFMGRGKDWLFKSEKDATMFILRWS
jgi:ssRNA-specific RNase YbeY (16S rRNA maturation enzyme)